MGRLDPMKVFVTAGTVILLVVMGLVWWLLGRGAEPVGPVTVVPASVTATWTATATPTRVGPTAEPTETATATPTRVGGTTEPDEADEATEVPATSTPKPTETVELTATWTATSRVTEEPSPQSPPSDGGEGPEGLPVTGEMGLAWWMAFVVGGLVVWVLAMWVWGRSRARW